MNIQVSKIPEAGMELRFERDGKWFRERLPENEPGDFELQTISVACTVRRIKENVFVEGKATSQAEAPCCRCLELSRVPVAVAFKYTLAPPAAEPQEEMELSADDLDYACYEEDIIDVDALVFEQILLQLPVKPLCRVDCKGLCPHCGIDLNVASCDCRTEAFDERLAVLKQFKVQPKKSKRRKEGI